VSFLRPACGPTVPDLPKPKSVLRIFHIRSQYQILLQFFEELFVERCRKYFTQIETEQGSPRGQSFLFLVCLLFSPGEEADSVLDGVDAVSDQRQDDEHDQDDDEDDKVSCDHDACGSR